LVLWKLFMMLWGNI